jgi:predicted PurR-regulated permease PerM
MGDMSDTSDLGIPMWILKWGGIAWRLAAIGVVAYFGFRAFARVEVIFISFAVALLLAAVLWLPCRWLMDHRWPPMLAAIAILATALVVLGGIFALIVPPLVDSFGDLGTDLTSLIESFRDWLTDGPLGLTDTNIENLIDRAIEQLQQFGADWIVSGATTAVEIVGGSFLVLIITFFLLKDARRLAVAFLSRRPPSASGGGRSPAT